MIYDGKHSVTFMVDGESKNSWRDWCLAPSSRPVIAPPSVREFSVEIEGKDGKYDFADEIFASPTLSNRTGTIEFLIDHDNEKYVSWYATYSEVMNFLHGKSGRLVLEDDPSVYYEGRFSVSDFKSESDYSAITIGYDLKPYKFGTVSTLSVDDSIIQKPNSIISKSIDDYTITLRADGQSVALDIADFKESQVYLDYMVFIPSNTVNYQSVASFNVDRRLKTKIWVRDAISFNIDPGSIKEYRFDYGQYIYKVDNQMLLSMSDRHSLNGISSFTVKFAFRSADI